MPMMNKKNKSDQDFRDFFDNVPDGVLLADIATKKFYYGNRSICRMLGCSLKQLKKMRVEDIHPKSEAGRVLKDFGRLARREISISRNVPIKGKNGRIFFMDINSSIPVKLEGKEMMIGFFRDVTSRKKAEEELQASQQRLAALVNFLPDATMAVNLEHRVIAWNEKMEILTGVPRKNILGRDDYQYALPFYGKRRPVLMDLVIKNDRRIEKKYSYIHKENDRLAAEMFIPRLNGGQGAYLSSIASPLYDENGKMVGAIESVRDITEYKRSEQELRQSRERFKNLVDLLPQTVFEMDHQGKLTFLNRNGLTNFGYQEKALAKGLNILQLIARVDRQRAAKVILTPVKAADNGTNDFLALRKDGSVFPAMVYSRFAVRKNSANGIRGILVDLTELKKVENSLKEIAAKDEALLASIADGVIAVDKNDDIILINRTALRMLACTEKEAKGKKWYTILRKEDERGNEIPPEKSDFENVLKTGLTFASITPYYYSGKKGKRFPVSRAISPVISAGKTIGAINVFRDITYEKELDQAKNDFLSLASHQLRTPLSVTKWILEMMTQTGGLSDKQKEYTRDLIISNERLIGLVNGLLNVTRIAAGKLSVNKKTVKLVPLIEAAIRQLRPTLEKKNQKINLKAKIRLKSVNIDPLLFSEAFSNILNNACNFAPENGKIDVTIGAGNNNYLVGIRNYGPMIAKSDQAKVFSKFYRGKNARNLQYVGSGLGLFIAKAAVEANGGKIWFKSTRAATTFYFTVPK